MISSINSYFKSQMREERVGQFPVSFLDPTEFQVPLRARLCTLPSYSVHFIALRTTVSTTVEFDVCIWSNVKQVFCCLCKQFSAVHFSVEKTVCATKYLSRFDICPGITFELVTCWTGKYLNTLEYSTLKDSSATDFALVCSNICTAEHRYTLFVKLNTVCIITYWAQCQTHHLANIGTGLIWYWWIFPVQVLK